MGKNYPDIKPGEIVSGGFTYPNNAQIVGDSLYIRDENGNTIAGRQTDNGDKITVLDVGYTKQLTLIQYPAGTSVRQGYVTNATNIIKYINQGVWKNGSSPESVYDENNTVIGSLDAYEVATPLYKISDGKTHVVYNTSKGANTKSGYVVYAGANGSSNPTGGINPGEVVPGGFTYPNNAQVIGDDLYIRDANGNTIAGRQVSNGDRITVLDVGYTKQLTLVQYPAGSVVRQGYVTNVPSLIKYDRQGEWHNGSSAEEVLDENGAHLGSLDPYEAATPLYKKNGMTHVVYNTDKGPNTKSGYVKYEGSKVYTSVTIPEISRDNIQKLVYGVSGKGRNLEVYKIGNGDKVLFAGFGIHGFEDNWPRDGIALSTIAIELLKKLSDIDKSNGLNGWSIYIAPSMNPDGLLEGWTNNGPGRCTISTSIDLNRSFPTGFSIMTDSRNYTGNEPLLAPEAQALSKLIKSLKNSSSRMVLLDFHGWLNETLGNSTIAKFFYDQFGFNHNPNYGGGYFYTWANSIGIESVLVEYPSINSIQEAIDRGFAAKTFDAIKGILSLSTSSQTQIDGSFYHGYNKSIFIESDIDLDPSVQEIIEYYDDMYLHADVAYDEQIIEKGEYLALKKKCEEEVERYRQSNSLDIKDIGSEIKAFLFDTCLSFIPIIGDALGNTIELSSKDTLDASAVRKITVEKNMSLIIGVLAISKKYSSVHTIYELYEEIDGKQVVRYVGRTRQKSIETRKQQHWHSDPNKIGLEIRVARYEGKELSNLRYDVARGMEDILYNFHGGSDNKMLLNRINPIRNGKEVYVKLLKGEIISDRIEKKAANYLKEALRFLGKLE